jgi:Barrel-sandwich domain of CusB or HlyD membrane-fusion
MTRARRVWLIAAVVLAVAIAAAILTRFPSGSRAAAPKGPAAITVTTAPVVVRSMPVKLYAGAVLFELDSRPFKAALDQAQANLAKDRAQLERANAQETRYQDLLRQKFISPDAYEQVRATAQSAAATVRADEAAVETVQLQLGFCTIRSPLDGYAGRIQIQQGNLVRGNDANPLVTVNKIIPVDVSFSVPEQNIDDIRRHQAAGDLIVQAQPPAASPHEPVSGRLSFIDNTADTTTGTIKLKAEFPNTGTELWRDNLSPSRSRSTNKRTPSSRRRRRFRTVRTASTFSSCSTI